MFAVDCFRENGSQVLEERSLAINKNIFTLQNYSQSQTFVLTTSVFIYILHTYSFVTSNYINYLCMHTMILGS